MCDIIFITPNIIGDIRSEAMGTLQLATILKRKGIKCDILPFYEIGNLYNFEQFLDNALKIVEEKKPKIVSFYTRCDVYHIDLKLAQLIKARWENIYIICGGPQADISADDTIRNIPYVDFVCCGEGETTIYSFISSLLRGNPDLSIPGLVYRVDGKTFKNPRPKLIEDLDSLPMLDYSMFKHSSNSLSHKQFFPIEVGRGCPFSCTFCSTNTFWGRKYRLKSPERIYLEIKDVHEHYGITRFKFTHDMFTLNRNKVIETCKLLKTLDFPITWGASARLDCIDPELINVMADAGMVRIFLGIESGSPRMQKLINKNLNLDKAVEIASYINKKGIKIQASFVYGFPEETEEDLSLTIALMGNLMKFKKIDIAPHLCAFFIGTELSRKYASEMTPVDFYSNETRDYAIEQCKDLIQSNPSIFTHMYEYKTPLRKKLRFFDLFIFVWGFAQPIYQYISEKYPQERLIEMYYDFLQSNQEVLDRISKYPEERWLKELTKEDRFINRFADDVNYDIMVDLYRYLLTTNSDSVRNGDYVSDIFCFDPRQIKTIPLQEYTRTLAAVTWENKKGTIVLYD